VKCAHAIPFAVVLLAGSLSACSLQLISERERPVATNTCQSDSDCGANAKCTEGACFATEGTLDDIFVEVIPESNSASGGLSFLSALTNVKNGDRNIDITVPGLSTFIVQVQVNADDLPDSICPPKIGTLVQTIGARVEFSRTSVVGDVPLLGLPRDSSGTVTVDTSPIRGDVTSGWNTTVFLIPGTYDIYIQPVTCPIAPRILRGVSVPEKVDAWAPPATLQLPTPIALNGRVQRTNDTVEHWLVEVIEPQEGRVISTSERLGTTSPELPTNFGLTYQPVAPGSSTSLTASTTGPLIRISPPEELATKAPTVYWPLEAAVVAGYDNINLDMSGVPRPADLVKISGQIKGPKGGAYEGGVIASLQFVSTVLDNAMGLLATFNPSIVTEVDGSYSIDLFPGQYRVIAVPVVALEAAQVEDSLAITESPTTWTVNSTTSAIPMNLVLSNKRVVRGPALAGPGSVPALGATFEAIPSVVPSKTGVLQIGGLAKAPILPQGATLLVSEGNTSIELPLDPGSFDLTLRAPESSNFAWWVWPGVSIRPPDPPISPTDLSGQTFGIEPHLVFPVPLEGVIRGPQGELRGAAVRAYAKAPGGVGVTKVGDARTDENGRYRLRLPPRFGP